MSRRQRAASRRQRERDHRHNVLPLPEGRWGDMGMKYRTERAG